MLTVVVLLLLQRRAASAAATESWRPNIDNSGGGGLCNDRYGSVDDIVTFRRRSCSYCYWFLFPAPGAPYAVRPPDPYLYRNVPRFLLQSSSRLFQDGSDAINHHHTPLVAANDSLDVVSNENGDRNHPELPNIIRLDPNNGTDNDEICRSLKPIDCWRWRTCCAEADNCCRQMSDRRSSTFSRTTNERPNLDGTTKTVADSTWNATETSSRNRHQVFNDVSGSYSCDMTWDGFSCWERASVGSIETRSCPTYLPHSQPFKKAVKRCTENGTWYERDGLPWTDYTQCLDISSYKISIYVAASFNILCLIVLVPAIAVFCCFRDLRLQLRVRVHVQFFLSLALSSLVNLVWNALVEYELLTNAVATETVIARNEVWCRFLSALKIYLTSCTYFWMLCEGCYLYRLLSRVFEQPESLTGIYLLGWMTPGATVGVYAIARTIKNSDSCWAINLGLLEWIIYGPNLLCLVVNLIFLCNIIRILLFRLQAHPSEPNNFRRALKAGIMLVPLFGLQLLLTIYRPRIDDVGQKAYEYVTLAVTNSQGVFVALIFCFFNNEVIALFCRHHRRSPFFASCCRQHRVLRLYSNSHVTTTQASINDGSGGEMQGLGSKTRRQRLQQRQQQQRHSETCWSIAPHLEQTANDAENFSQLLPGVDVKDQKPESRTVTSVADCTNDGRKISVIVVEATPTKQEKFDADNDNDDDDDDDRRDRLIDSAAVVQQ